MENPFNTLHKYSTILSFPKGTTIIKQGQFGQGIYVIKRGNVSVITRAPSSSEIVLAKLDEGSFFGETSLFEARPSAASVLASTDIEVYFLSNKIIQGLREIDPLLWHRLIEVIAGTTCIRIRQKIVEIRDILKKIHPDKMRQVCARINKPPKSHLSKGSEEKQLEPDDPIISQIFKEFSLDEISILLGHMTHIKAEEKSILFHQEEDDVSCYFTLSGVAYCIVESGPLDSKLSICGPGDLLGQVDFIAEKERIITAVLREDSQFLRISGIQKKELELTQPVLWSRLHYIIANEVVRMLYLVSQLLMRMAREIIYV